MQCKCGGLPVSKLAAAFTHRLTQGCACLVWVALAFTGVRAEEPRALSEYEIKAALLYKVTKFVEWPEQTFDLTKAGGGTQDDEYPPPLSNQPRIDFDEITLMRPQTWRKANARLRRVQAPRLSPNGE